MTAVAKPKLVETIANAPAADPLARLREPFPAHQISKLPKESKTQADQRKADRNTAINCKICGGWHHKNAVHLDYVGHAALTDRLLDTDRAWSWEPMSFTADGLPALDKNGGLWIKLTVCDVTRLGYGSADGKTGGDAIKELIGDALRNAAMRFGAALDLWHKGDLHLADDAGDEKPEPPKSDAPKVEPKREPERPLAVVAAEAAIIQLRTLDECDEWDDANGETMRGLPKAQGAAVWDFMVAHRKSLETGLRQSSRTADFRAEELEGAFQ
jgi:hypothetical protein